MLNNRAVSFDCGRFEKFGDEFLNIEPSRRLRSAAVALAAHTGTSPSLRLGISAGELGNAKLLRLHAYWQSLRCGGAPSYRELDPLHLKFALGNIMLAEPIAGGADFRYRVGATVVATVLGVELTGKTLSACFPPPERTFCLACYQETLERGAALYTFHAPPPDVPIASWERLLLPLFDDDGAVVRVLAGIIPGDARIPQRDF